MSWHSTSFTSCVYNAIWLLLGCTVYIVVAAPMHFINALALHHCPRPSKKRLLFSVSRAIPGMPLQVRQRPANTACELIIIGTSSFANMGVIIVIRWYRTKLSVLSTISSSFESPKYRNSLMNMLPHCPPLSHCAELIRDHFNYLRNKDPYQSHWNTSCPRDFIQREMVRSSMETLTIWHLPRANLIQIPQTKLFIMLEFKKIRKLRQNSY